MSLWQVGIDIQIEARRPALDPAEQQALDRIETNRPQPEGLAHGRLDLVEQEALQETQRTWTYSRLPAAPWFLGPIRASRRRRKVAKASGKFQPLRGAAWSSAPTLRSMSGR